MASRSVRGFIGTVGISLLLAAVAWLSYAILTDHLPIVLVKFAPKDYLVVGGCWLGLLLVLVVWFVPKWYVGTLPPKIVNDKGELVDLNSLDREEGMRDLLVKVIGGLVVLAGLHQGWQEYQLAREKQDLDRDQQVTELYAKAIDQLGDDNMDVRIGGIYTLGRIAKNYPEDYHWTVVEVLCAFVRVHAPWPPSPATDKSTLTGASRHPNADVQVALTVLGRRDNEQRDLTGHEMFLFETDLRGARLPFAHLDGANLVGSHLENANLIGTQWTDANLDLVHLDGAELSESDLSSAKYLQWDQLQSAVFEDAILPNVLVSTPEGYARAKSGRANLDGVPVPKT